MSQMKGQYKTPEKKEMKWRLAPFRKRTQNNDSEDDPGCQKQNGEDARNVYQRPGRNKEQTNRDEQYTRRNQ